MKLDRVYGQERVKQVLEPLVRTLREEKIESLFLEFIGPEGVGKLTTAIEMAKAVNCESNQDYPCGNCSHCVQIGHFQYPDLILIIPGMSDEKDQEKSKWKEVYRTLEPRLFYSPIKQIKIEEVRDTIKELWRERPYSGRYRFVIVVNGENLNQYSQNAFLKTLEELYPRTVVIFIVSVPQKILPTVHSRAKKIRFNYLSLNAFMDYFGSLELEFNKTLLFQISSRSIGRAKRYIHTNFLDVRSKILKNIFESDIDGLITTYSNFINGRKGDELGILYSGFPTDILDFYGVLAEDLLLIKNGLPELIVNTDLKPRLLEFSGKIREDIVLEMLRVYKEVSYWIRSNVDESLVPYALMAPFIGRDFKDTFRSY